MVAGAVVYYADFDAGPGSAGLWVEVEGAVVGESGAVEDVLPFTAVAWGVSAPETVFDGSFVGDVEVVGLHDREDAGLFRGGVWGGVCFVCLVQDLHQTLGVVLAN